jgi:hypothetical protein
MKNIFKHLSIASAALLVLAGCSKEENKVYLQGGNTPVLSASTAAVRLTSPTENETAVTFNWTNPEYKFNTGISSHDVSYTLEMDTLGANFSSPTKYVTTISKDLSKTYIEKDFNSILGNTMLLKSGRQYTIETRIIASIGTASSAKLISNTFKVTATPFTPPPKVTLPTSGNLYLVGSASPGGWNNPVPTPSQQFNKLSNTLYEMTISLSGGGSVLFLPVNGDWGDKYGWSGSNNGNNPNGDNLSRGGGDILVPAASGNYKIQVDFQLGKFTFTKL